MDNIIKREVAVPNIANSEKNCCGCSLCANICPQKAIMIKANKKGFLFPQINAALCVSCGACEKVCPLINNANGKRHPLEAYMAKNRDEKVRSNSSSGGIFSAIATAILCEGGVVYGAAYTDNFVVKHTRVENISDLYKLRGSKYVQSELISVIDQIFYDLKSGRIVLFSGTPCQVHGISIRFAHYRNKGQLICVDIICHGVPSPDLFKDHIRTLTEKYGKIKSYRSRSKLEGWHSGVDRMITDNGDSVSLSNSIQANFVLFKTNLCLRECCYICRYATIERVGDITIGDYWGVEKFHKEWDDNKGTSLVLINTMQGCTVFKKILKSIKAEKCTFNEILQPHLRKPTIRPDKTDEFWREYQLKGFSYIARKYGRQSNNRIVKRIIKRAIFLISNFQYKEELE